MRTLKCDGSCEEHLGEVRQVFVKGWGTFNYCDTAIEQDKKDGFTVFEGDEIAAHLISKEQ